MPQFDVSKYSSQIFWLLVSFGVLFLYVRFYFLPKLESILIQRNKQMDETKERIERNNAIAKRNLEDAEKSIKEANVLANKIIADAMERAKIEEEKLLREIQESQRKAIMDVIQKQGVSQSVIDEAVRDSVRIVLKKIGIDVSEDDLEKALRSVNQ